MHNFYNLCDYVTINGIENIKIYINNTCNGDGLVMTQKCEKSTAILYLTRFKVQSSCA